MRSLERFVVVVALSWAFESSAGVVKTETCEKSQRTIEFRTEEGAMSNVDVAPDGKTLAFDLLGDIYLVSSAGGHATPITGGPAWDVRPVWSPDGKQIAFISDLPGTDEVFTIDLPGAARPVQVTSGVRTDPGLLEGIIAAVEWTPDGAGFVVGGYQYGRDGASMPPRSETRWLHGGPYNWNGDKLFHYRPEAPAVPSRNGEFRIWSLAAGASQWVDTGDLVTSTPSGYEAPVQSRDGRFLVFKDRAVREPVADSTAPTSWIDSIRVRDRRTGKTRILIGPTSEGWESSPSGGFSHRGRFAISPDSRNLFVAYGGRLHSFDLESGTGTTVPVTIDVKQCLTPIVRHAFSLEDDHIHLKNIRGATIRADGKQLAFSVLRKLYTMTLPDGIPRRVDGHDGQFQPAYSPDGNWIAFATWGPDGGHLWKVPSKGGEAIQLTKAAGYYQTPTWSPDGKSIAFVGHPDVTLTRPGFTTLVAGGNIQILSIADGRIEKLPALARAGHPLAFTADGRRIHYVEFTEDYDVGLRTSAVGLDGVSRRHHELSTLLPSGGAAVALPSPDGRKLALIKSGNLYLAQCEIPIGSSRFSAKECSSRQITNTGAYDPRWARDGSYLEWSFANRHYKLRIDSLAGLDGGTMPAIAGADAIQISMDVPRKRAAGKIMFLGARIITLRGKEIIEDGAILVENGRITRVGFSSDVSVPTDAIVISVHGKTILPGFIDSHAHLNDLPRDLLDSNNGEALAYLAFGVTTVKNPSNGGDHAHAYAELIESGDMIGPRMFGAEGLVEQSQTIESFEDARNLALRTKLLGGKFLKYHTGWDRRGRRWIIDAAGEAGLNVAAHFPVSNYIPGRINFTTIADGVTSSEHEFSDDQQFQDVSKYLAQSGTFINFAPLGGYGRYGGRYWPQIKNDPRIQRFHVGRIPRASVDRLPVDSENALPPLASPADKNARLIAQIAHEGGNVTIGSHGDFDGIGFHWEMWAHVRGGMSSHEVLEAATLNGARSLGMEEYLGSIERGKIADLLILDKNPIDDIRNTLSVERVMKDGVLRDAMTLDEVWPIPAPMPHWRRSEGSNGHAH